MKRLLIFLTLLLGVAFAQDPNWNFKEWGQDFAGFVGVIVVLIAVGRRYAFKSLDGDAVKGIAVLLGVVLGVASSFAGVFDGWLAGATTGLLAGLASFVGVDVLRDVVIGQGMSGKSEA
jgi:low temperature requirement protein LtrA